MRSAETEIKSWYREGDGPGRIIPGDEVCENISDIRKTLHSDISFEDSCVDMGWDWEVEEIFSFDYEKDVPSKAGYRLRTTFRRPDRNTGKIDKGFGRWHEVPLEPTVSAVVKTAFVACKMILEHELMEALKWKGQRVFDPHNTVQELAALNPARYTRSIP